jgi:hypothetical protein
MNYLEYLKQPHYLALACAVVSAILAYAESRFSKVKYEKKYYFKIMIIVFLNVFIVVNLIKRNVITVNGINAQVGGASPDASLSAEASSSINTSNYEAVDIGSPNF